MNLLALTSSSSQGVLALRWKGETSEYSLGFRHSENLFIGLDYLLKKYSAKLSDIDGLAIDLGPGSFTGIRVAVNFAKSLCYSISLPIFSANSFDLMSWSLPNKGVIFQNAYQESVFLGTFSNGQMNSSIEVFEWKKIPENYLHIPDWYGTSTPQILEIQKNRAFLIHHRDPQVQALLELAQSASSNLWTKDWKSILPLYIKSSAAEELRAKLIAKN